ncbi:hypothetical protein FHS83_003078 [Rhizomicrobium palustre]|uniref:Uncharacterized protein n=1 Tax=Rhizomicrobium palustre TaxID=189966 RepID=A0A846N3W5_9PROT|nr:hypothetical protein [Rhizomicrobium palustre]NIK89760.1 hypothetical protein [Rhizomicrobium palustre]
MTGAARIARVWAIFAGLIFVFHVYDSARAAESAPYSIRATQWSDADERSYERFIASIGESDCGTLDECLRSSANPFFGSDPPSRHFYSDCAQLPYLLRFYYAFKRGLPFSYVNGVAAHDAGVADLRYSRNGNKPVSRRDLASGRNGYAILDQIRGEVSSASYRIHPDIDGPVAPDFYSPAIKPGSIRPGTVVYDPAGHVAIVYRVDPDGQIHSFDAHTDFTLTQLTFDVRFARSRPAQGSGFKNWRPLRLVGAEKHPDGSYRGGRIVAAKNSEIADFSTEQFYGTGPRPKEEAWASGSFTVKGQTFGYYDFVRARLAGGVLRFDPIKEIGEMTSSLCSDLQYRAGAVELARRMSALPHPARLPRNIYGSDGDWEMFSTPSRDARLKIAFKYLRDMAQRFVELAAQKDTSHLAYKGSNLAGDLLKTYQRASATCIITYRKSNGAQQSLSFEESRLRLFQMSFDPYHCPERRWGASDPAELSSCRDGEAKKAWYDAEQPLRNQIERTYDARMDFTLDELKRPGVGAAFPPDTDVARYLTRAAKQE